jgi:hypothetical protein
MLQRLLMLDNVFMLNIPHDNIRHLHQIVTNYRYWQLILSKTSSSKGLSNIGCAGRAVAIGASGRSERSGVRLEVSQLIDDHSQFPNTSNQFVHA